MPVVHLACSKFRRATTGRRHNKTCIVVEGNYSIKLNIRITCEITPFLNLEYLYMQFFVVYRLVYACKNALPGIWPMAMPWSWMLV
jgi:hypothetical protein